MSFLFGPLFWGTLLILFGLSMVVRAVFNIDVPIFRFLLAVILIYIGVKILLNKSDKGDDNTRLFTSTHVSNIKTDSNYDTIFGKSRIDLRDTELEVKDIKVNIDVIFGSADVLIDPNIPARIKISTVFAEGRIPKGSVGAFSDHIYETPAYASNANALYVKIDVVFGSVNVIE